MKFSIRDLFLVTVIVAVCVAWWLDHRRMAAEVSRLNSRRFIDNQFFGPRKSLPTSQAPGPNPKP